MSRCLPGFAAVALFSLCISVLLLTAPLYLMQLFDRVLPSRSADTLILLFVFSIAALLALGALDSVRSILLARIGARFDTSLSSELYMHGMSLQARSNDQVSLQGLNDLAVVRAFISGPAVIALMDAPWTPIFMLVIFALHPALGWLSLAGGVVLLGVAFVGERISRPLIVAAGERSLTGVAEAAAAIRNADVVEAMGMKPTMVDRWRSQNHAAVALELRAGQRVGLVSGFSKFLRFALQIATMTAGAWLVVQNELTAGGMTAAALLLARALAPLEQVIAASKGMASASGAYGRLRARLRSKAPRRTRNALPAPSGLLTVENLMFAHPEARQPLIRGLTFRVMPGEALGIVGPTAAGKTTLARLLVGNLTPMSGCVRMDGMDVSAWDHDDLGRHIGYLPQDVQLFAGTVQENIARMSKTDISEVIAAARLAGVHDLVMSLPRGYETEIGRGGMSLSGGQRQRIGLARALYGNPRLVVLDEPNANLDRDGELALVHSMATCKSRGTTVIVIAHRPQILAQVDSMLVLRPNAPPLHGKRDEVVARLARSAPDAAAGSERRLVRSERDSGPAPIVEGRADG